MTALSHMLGLKIFSKNVRCSKCSLLGPQGPVGPPSLVRRVQRGDLFGEGLQAGSLCWMRAGRVESESDNENLHHQYGGHPTAQITREGRD